MNTKRMSLLSLLALIIFLGVGVARDAEAEILVSATLHTSDMSISIGYRPVGYYQRCPSGYIPIRTDRYHRIDSRDRGIARRLARYTGVPASNLLRLRRYGYTWYEIGRWLDLPPRVIRAAANQQSWNRLFHYRLTNARRGIGAGGGRRIGRPGKG